MKKVPAKIIKPHWEAELDDSYQSKWLAGLINKWELSLKQFGDALGVSKQTIGNWLYGKIQMKYASVVAICRVSNDYYDPDEVYATITADFAERGKEK